MSAKDYKFVSPGVFIEEIDNSQLPDVAVAIGPVVIGRSRRGPAFRPVRVQSFSEFITLFGDPVAGQESSDVWRGGIPTAPTFAAYAAQAWLKNNAPLTFIRLLGDQHPQASTTDDNAMAGWKMAAQSGASSPNGGGAYGLFLFNSGAAAATEVVDGALAAIFYCTEGAPTLSGSIRDSAGGFNTGSKLTGSSAMICSLDSNQTFKVRVYNKAGNRLITSEGNSVKETIFNFSNSSQNFIRKVFNTNPTKTNSQLINTDIDSTNTFFLGQSYERHLKDVLTEGANTYGCIMRIGNGTTMADGGNFKFATTIAQTGWFFSQDLRNTAADANPDLNATLNPQYNPENSNTVTKLFKLHTLSCGEEEQRQFKISIEDIRYSKNDNSPYGSFTLAIRDIRDTDGAKKYVERYTECNLDPSSPNYIAKQIGDMYVEWDTSKKRLVEYGSYPNISKIVRVEVASAVESGQTNPELLPFGVYGPTKLKDFTMMSDQGVAITGSQVIQTPAKFLNAGSASAATCFGAVSGAAGEGRVLLDENSHTIPFTGSVKFPALPLRVSATVNELSDPTEAYFGAQFTRDTGSVVFDPSTLDVLYSLPKGAGGADGFSAVTDTTQVSWYFSLDDLQHAGLGGENGGNTSGSVYYASGSRSRGTSITAMTGSYKAILDKGYDRFTSPLYGGFNGFDITEKEPFNQRALLETSTPIGYAMNYSVKKAVDMYADAEFIEGNILAAPGIVNEGLTTSMVEVAEGRGDTLAIIDPRGGYTPSSENYKSEKERIVTNHVNDVVNKMTSRNLNSSYGAAYYPWVRITDTISGQGIWAPPSVAALGALSFSERQSDLWFAPAGFNRGGLTQGAAGIPVTMVRSKLTSKERDELYDANINPIATFPNEGIVIFGQKTLQVTPSALDRINVRRLMIFVKKEISRIATNLLFEPNVDATWNRFKTQVNPFLNNIKNNFGLDAFKVVLDKTTTTPDLIDRNTIYAKIFLKPTKAVEFFAIDFVITNSGAGFED
tara:strand:+ start:115 stop:3132 length:3018 start_codon:yes stop_codon:yes gene_type:complete